jgi:hypothetical protein
LLELVESYTIAMRGLGGIVIREALGRITDSVMTNVDKPWKRAVAKILESSYENIDAKLAMSLSEHFMGKKNIPDFRQENKALTKKFLNLGIQEDEFYDLMKVSFKELDKLLSSELGKKVNDAKSFLTRLKTAELEFITNKSDEEKKKIIEAAVEVYPPIFLEGIKEFFVLEKMEKEQRIAREKAEELRQQLNEIRFVTKLVGALL